MKIAAYMLVVLDALIWAFLTMLAANLLRSWWIYSGEPFSDNGLITGMTIALPPVGLLIVISSAFFLRHYDRRFLFAACILTVATLVGGLKFIAYYGAGV
ncbi:MAG: hypothetical protein JO256_06935 [Alphaproteobacteria bacterium]|nr:hypothetical protein [Alphaproteobacteria bacterium]